MFERKLFRYKLKMVGPTGTSQDEEFLTYWSPAKTSIDEIRVAASAMFTGKASRGMPGPVVWRCIEAKLVN